MDSIFNNAKTFENLNRLQRFKTNVKFGQKNSDKKQVLIMEHGIFFEFYIKKVPEIN